MTSKAKSVKMNNENVNLKKLELLGFKSFPDKTEITFDTNYTGIVGPNGCGKSNIVDAIRFVLGEGRPTLLRCENMSKLIFEGSASRKSFSYCEVSIYLNNNPRKYPIEYDEVVITRKLDRTGNSEYLINQKKHKLKDVINLFRDSGIGRDGYSIVGQGQIAKIFESSPINRRGIFEEAVGISLQKSQKEDTERRLARARDNMSRLNDIILEVEKQLSPLKKQAKNAKDVKDLKKRLKILEIFNYIDKKSISEIEKKKLAEELNKVEKNLTEIEIKLEDISKELNNAMLDRTNTDIMQNKLAEKRTEIAVAEQKAIGEKALLSQEIQTHEEKIKEIEATIKIHSDLLDVKNKEINKKTEDILNLNKNLEKIDLDIKTEEQKYLKKREEVSSLEKAHEQANTMLLEGDREKSKIDKTVATLEVEKGMLLADVSGGNDLFNQKNKQLEDYKKLIEQNENELIELNSLQNEFENKLNLETKEYESKALELEKTKQKIADIEKQIVNLEFEHKIIKASIENFDSYDAAVQTIMQKGAIDKEFAKLYHGTVGELIKVNKDLAIAIEFALGNAIQNIIVEDEYYASKLIDFLKKDKSGRATFLPLSAMKKPDMRYIDSGICNEEGVIGIASDLISFDPKYESAIQYLLGRTVIIEDKSYGIKISKKYNNLVKLVSLDGEVFHPSGAITGGSVGRAIRKILQSENRLKEIQIKLNSTTKDLERFKDLKNEIESINSLLFNSIKVSEARIAKIKQDHAVKTSEKEKNASLYSDLENEIKGLTVGKEQSYARIKELEKIIAAEKEKLDLIGDSEIAPEDFVNEVKNKLFKVREELNDVQSRFNDLKISEQTLKTQKFNLENQINQLEKDINFSQELIKTSSKNLEETKLKLNNAKNNIDASNFSDESKKMLEEIDAKIKEATLHKSKLDEKFIKLNNLKNEYNDSKSKSEKRKYTIESEILNINSSLEMLADRVMENYQYEDTQAEHFLKNDVDKAVIESIDSSKVSEEIKNINNKIDRIGPVNELADEEYEETLKRHDEMQQQYQDLLDAEKDMVKMIKNLTAEMSEKFSKNFQKINEYFQEMFVGLFGGGKAYLELEPDVDVLEAGIEIKAQLPGSKLSSIISLSGGEKGLISIAILFAIIKLNPMPFCVLDEIDSALDEANSDLLGQYLKKFSDDTQFIIVTHKKPTMEQCDVLYGITSQEKGVSQQVKVELEEAVELSKQTVSFED